MFILLKFIRKIFYIQLILNLRYCLGNSLYQSRSGYTCYEDKYCYRKTSCDSDCCNVWIKNENGDCILYLPEDYEPPEFTYCPPKTHRITVYISEYQNVGYLPNTGITAEDWDEDSIPVTFSKREFRHCNCSDPHEIVTATAKDRYETRVSCNFTVIIIDEHPPTFKICPEHQTIPSTERVIWKIPTVTDNVGVKEIIPPDFPNNIRYSPGLYKMVYEATDWDGNVAKCMFEITVINEEGDGEIKSKHKLDPTLAISGTIVGALCIILIVIITAMFRLCRKRHQLRNRTDRRQSRFGMIFAPTNTTEDNQVFTIYNNDPPPYDIIAKDRLPTYSLRDDPPSYEEIEQQSYQGEDNFAFSFTESRHHFPEENTETNRSCRSVVSRVNPEDLSVVNHTYQLTNPQSIHTEV